MNKAFDQFKKDFEKDYGTSDPKNPDPFFITPCKVRKLKTDKIDGRKLRRHERPKA